MNRFFLFEEKFLGNKVVFPGDIAHQIHRVLRLKSGDQVEVLDNLGNAYRVALEINPDGGEVSGVITTSYPIETEPGVRLTLCFGLSNREKTEWILQKGTEIGVSVFFPFISSRTLVQKKELSQSKVARWERIIREAAEQSGRGNLPELRAPDDYANCLAKVSAKTDHCLIAWESASPAQSLKHLRPTLTGKSVGILVGPEGGFSEVEIDQAQACGCQVVSLGKRILRMETAAIVLPALLLSELGEF